MTSQIFVFFTPEDERNFSVELRKLRPHVRFVEEKVAGTPLHLNLDNCQSKFAYLLDFGQEDLEHGFYSPELKLVNNNSLIFIERSVEDDGVLLSGTWKFGTPEDGRDISADIALWKDVGKVARKLAGEQVCHIEINPLVALAMKVMPTYIIGAGTSKWLRESEFHILRDRSVTHLFYLTPAVVEERLSVDL